MVINIEKQKGENSRSLGYRFTRAVRRSRVLALARKKRFFHSPKSKQEKKKAALRKSELTKKYDELRKLGKAK